MQCNELTNTAATTNRIVTNPTKNYQHNTDT